MKWMQKFIKRISLVYSIYRFLMQSASKIAAFKAKYF